MPSKVPKATLKLIGIIVSKKKRKETGSYTETLRMTIFLPLLAFWAL
jgi:hypothetical protein